MSDPLPQGTPPGSENPANDCPFYVLPSPSRNRPARTRRATLAGAFSGGHSAANGGGLIHA